MKNQVRVTKKMQEAYLKSLLSQDKGARRGLLLIFENQTEDEQNSECTMSHNNIGFTGVDGEILSSFAKQFIQRGSLSPKQMNLLKKKMPKYWRQILPISDQEKLNAQIIENLKS